MTNFAQHARGSWRPAALVAAAALLGVLAALLAGRTSPAGAHVDGSKTKHTTHPAKRCTKLVGRRGHRHRVRVKCATKRRPTSGTGTTRTGTTGTTGTGGTGGTTTGTTTATTTTTTATTATTTTATTTTATTVHPWPYTTLQLGLASAPGDAASQASEAPFGLRYQYLAGGVNTGSQWETWGDGEFVSEYISESEANGAVPVFSYYELCQSSPGDCTPDDWSADSANLANATTMLAYFENVRDFFKQAAAASGPVVLQVEPDLWGFIEQAAAGNDGATVPVDVAASGMRELAGLPNNAVGLAQAFLRLRNEYAPKVILAYPISIWGTGADIQANHPANAQVTAMAATAVAFYRSLHAPFDALTTEMSNADADYAKLVEGDNDAWWTAADFAHLGQFIGAVHQALALPVVIWQIPVGNAIMQVMDDSAHHYQDNKVQSLLGANSGAQALLASYGADGVAGLLFGGALDGDTCACDDAGNNPSNLPNPIDGNTQASYNDDDDGGYLAHQAALYYQRGAIRWH